MVIYFGDLKFGISFLEKMDNQVNRYIGANKATARYLGPKLWNDTFKTGVILVDIQKKNIPM